MPESRGPSGRLETSISDTTGDCAVGTATSGNVLERPIGTDREGVKSMLGACTEQEWVDEEERERASAPH